MRPDPVTTRATSANRSTVFTRTAASLRSLGWLSKASTDKAAVEADGPDGSLLALQPVWRLAEAEHRFCMDILEIHEGRRDRVFPLDVRRTAEVTSPGDLNRRTIAAIKATNAVAERVFALPARTIGGVLFKREVLKNYGRGDRPAFEDSLWADLLATLDGGRRLPPLDAASSKVA